MIPITLIKESFKPASVSPRSGTRRLRLWEIPAACHCAIIGVCLPISVLRRLAGKVLLDPAAVDDYALHSKAVHIATHRNPFSKVIQAELETRYIAEIQALRKCTDALALATAWREAVATGQVAGALWAVLSHPACDASLSESVGQQMHMLQHQAGAGMHLDVARFHALQEENAVLAHALAKAQQRCEQITQEKSVKIAQQDAQLVRLRAEIIGRDSELTTLQTELEALQRSQPDQAACLRLERQLRYQEERCARLSLENARLAKAQTTQPLSPAAPVQAIQKPDPGVEDAPEASLSGQRILCVGGREHAVVIYRQLIEQAGGRFLHHDGGVEDRLGQLDSALGAADLVICQTGCISHNAYWRVKDHCKRTGKRCSFVETPSVAGLARGLRRLLADVLVAPTDDVQNAMTGGAMTTGLKQT